MTLGYTRDVVPVIFELVLLNGNRRHVILVDGIQTLIRLDYWSSASVMHDIEPVWQARMHGRTQVYEDAIIAAVEQAECSRSNYISVSRRSASADAVCE